MKMKRSLAIVVTMGLLLCLAPTALAAWSTTPAFSEPFTDTASVFTSGNWTQVSSGKWTVNNGLVRNNSIQHETSEATCKAFIPTQSYRISFDIALGYSWMDSGYAEVRFNQIPDGWHSQYVFSLYTQSSTQVKLALGKWAWSWDDRAATTKVSTLKDHSYGATYHYDVDFERTADNKGLITVTQTRNGVSEQVLQWQDSSPLAINQFTLVGYYAGATFQNLKVYYPSADWQINGATQSTTGNTVTVTATIQKGSDAAQVFAALYDAQGRLIGVKEMAQTAAPSFTEQVILPDGKTAAKAKVFVWKAIADALPLCASAVAQ